MKITIKELRRIIREAGLDTDMRNMAGSIGCGGGSNRTKADVHGVDYKLGDAEHQEKEEELDDYGQEKTQAGIRRDDRAGDTGGSTRIRRRH